MALISNIIVSTLLFKKYYYTLEELIGLLFYENVGLICGAKKLAYWLSNSKEPFNFINAGLSAYGAIFGASFFIILFCFQFHKSIKETFLLLAPSFPLMYSIGKIGCFIAGCCYGINYNGLFKIIYKHSKSAPNNVYLFPVQLIESIIFFIIFIYLIYQHKKNKYNLKVLCMTAIICSLTKFILDFFRMSHSTFFSANQIISLILIALGAFTFKISKKN